MNNQKFVAVRTGNGAVLVNLDELIYVNYDGSTVFLTFKNSKMDFEFDSDAELAEKLIDELFERINPTIPAT